MSVLRLFLAARLKTKGIISPCISKVIFQKQRQVDISSYRNRLIANKVTFVSGFLWILEKPVETVSSQGFIQNQDITDMFCELLESRKQLSCSN